MDGMVLALLGWGVAFVVSTFVTAYEFRHQIRKERWLAIMLTTWFGFCFGCMVWYFVGELVEKLQ